MCNSIESRKHVSCSNISVRILVYPFSGPGALNVTKSDLARLKPDEFLNDTLIELGLKQVLRFALKIASFNLQMQDFHGRLARAKARAG